MVAPAPDVHVAGRAHADVASSGAGATAQAKAFAERLARPLARTPADIDLRTLCRVIGAHTPEACAPLERAVCDAALQASSTSAESARKAALSCATDRIAKAGEAASSCAAERMRTDNLSCVALFAGSELAAAACTKARVSELRLIGAGEVLDTAADAGSKMRVLSAPLECAGEMLQGAGALIMGAVEVAHNGAVLTAPGSGGLCYMASRLQVPVLVVAQTAKFTDRVLCASVHEGFDVLKPHEVEVVCTELGQFEPSRAPDVYKKMNVEH